ncbi:MAG: ATP12 family protein [Pseudomonadota bacterium]
MNDLERHAKRFYDAVSILNKGDRYVILLDGRTALTPQRNPLSSPSEKLACAVAKEWDSQKPNIDRSLMPLTGILSAAIDGGEALLSEYRQDILNYLGSDLLCYRADAPRALVCRQAEKWDPFIHWFNEAFGQTLNVTTGVIAVQQPNATLRAVSDALIHEATEAIHALRIATALAGSAVLALALWKSAFDKNEIFNASRVDEQFQAERWGADEEASLREETLRREFLSVAQFLSLL